MSTVAASGIAAALLAKLHRLRGLLVHQNTFFRRDVLMEEGAVEFLELVRGEVARAKQAARRNLAEPQTHSPKKPSVRFAAHTDRSRVGRPENPSKATESPATQSRRQSAVTGIIKLNGLKYFRSPDETVERGSSMKSKGSKRSLSSGHQKQRHVEPFDDAEEDRVDLSKYRKMVDASSFSLRINKRLSLRDGNLVKFATESFRRARPADSRLSSMDNSGEERSRLVVTERSHMLSIDESQRTGTKVFNIVHQPDKSVQVLNLNSPRFINKRFVISSEPAGAQSDRTQDFFDSKLVLQEPNPKPKKRKAEYLSDLLLRASANLHPKPPPKLAPKIPPPDSTPKHGSSRKASKGGGAIFQSPLEKLFWSKNK